MEGSVTVAAFGSATHLALTPSPASPTAGDNFTLTVRALDRNNNIVGDFNGTVTLSNPTGSAASFSPNPVSITNGVGTATANLHSSGNQTIHAINGAISGDASVTVITAGATHFDISASVSPVQHRNFNFTVSVRDQFENVAAGYAGVVQVSSASDPTAVFTPASAQLANGSGAFAVTFDAVGMQDITASDGLLSGTIAVNVIRDCDYLDETFPRLATANGITMTSGDFGLHSSVPNPSQITVSGMSGRVVGKVTVGINGFNEAHSSNAGFLLVGPGGQALILMSGVGGTGAVSNVNLRFDDAASGLVPQTTPASQSYQPTARSTYIFLSPAPTNPNVPAPNGNSTLASTFLGTDPNGTWSLYGVDRGLFSSGSISNWNLTITPATSFSNQGSITINDAATSGEGVPATPYPSQIAVSGLRGEIADVAITLHGFSHTKPSDVSLLLVGPGFAFLPLSHAGGQTGESDVTFTLDDRGAGLLPQANFSGNTFQPAAYANGVTTAFPSPAPGSWASPAPVGTATFGSTFGSSDPNGLWSLYVMDDNPGGQGSLAGGWSLTITVKCPTPTICQAASGTNPSSFNQPVTFTSAVTATGSGTPTGTATFNDGSMTLGSVPLDGSGHAVLTTPALAVGTHNISVDYADGLAFDGSTSTVITQIVNPAATSTTLFSSDNPTTYNQATLFTGQVATAFGGIPTGTVTFTDLTNGAMLGSPAIDISGKATLLVSDLSAGSHLIQATYSGDPSFLASSESSTQVVNKAASSADVISSLNPSTFGAAVGFTAAISSSNGGAPTGMVTFMDGATAIGSGSLTEGQFGLLAALSVGTHNITVVYAGDANFAGSTSPQLVQTVNKASSTCSVTSSRNPSSVGDSVTFTATVASSGGTPPGSVTFLDGASSLGSAALVNHRATLTTTALAATAHSITVSYEGDANFNGSTSAVLTQTVNLPASTTSLTSASPFLHFRQIATLTITVASSDGTPTGTVILRDNGKAIATLTLVNGAVNCSPPLGQVGLHVLTVDYNGDANFAGSTSNSINQYQSARPHGDQQLPAEQ